MAEDGTAHAGSVTVDLSVLGTSARGAFGPASDRGRVVLTPPSGMKEFPPRVKSKSRSIAPVPAVRPGRDGRERIKAAPPPPDRKIPQKKVASPGAGKKMVRLGSARQERTFGPGRRYRLEFRPGQNQLDAAARQALDGLAGNLEASDLRLELRSYAGGMTDTESQARWVSLSRALAVRGYLMTKGIDSGRIEVRALGRNATSGPVERVDVVVTTK